MNEMRNRIVKLMFVDTGTYNPMVNRPYETTADQHTLLKLHEVTDGGKVLNERSMGSLARNILKPNARHAGFIEIPNGWNEKRMMFMMEIHTDDGGIRRRHFISGFTDYQGYTTSVARTVYDPNMRLYINNHITCVDNAVNTDFGKAQSLRLLSANRLLHGSTNMQFTPNYGAAMVGDVPLRPKDVMSRVDQKYISQINGGVTVVGTDEAFINVKSSSIANDKPSSYLTKTLTAMRDAQQAADPDTDTMSSIMANAKSMAPESEVVTDPLFYQFKNYAQSFFATRSITFGELCRMQPTVDDITEHYSSTAMRRDHTPVGLNQTNHHSGDTQSWEGGQQTTIAATIITQAAPALMAECLMMAVGISASNCTNVPGATIIDTPNGPFSVMITKALTFGNVDIVNNGIMMSFARRFIHEILYDVSHHGAIGVTVHATLSLGTTENNLKIQMDGQNWETYNSPAFCDSMFSPVVAKDISHLDVLARDFSAMQDCITTQFEPVRYGLQAAPRPQRFNDVLNNSQSGSLYDTATKFTL